MEQINTNFKMLGSKCYFCPSKKLFVLFYIYIYIYIYFYIYMGDNIAWCNAIASDLIRESL